jgi:predicted nucleic acid-binding protein
VSHTPTPYVLDTGVLIEIARGDLGLITLMQTYDSRDQPLVVPTLALVGASLDARSEEADDLLAGLDLLDAVTIAPLAGPEQAAALAAVISRTGLDPWNAHVAAVADASVCPILTLDRTTWEGPSRAMDDPLHFMVIADPDQ